MTFGPKVRDLSEEERQEDSGGEENPMRVKENRGKEKSEVDMSKSNKDEEKENNGGEEDPLRMGNIEGKEESEGEGRVSGMNKEGEELFVFGDFLLLE